MAKSWYVLHTFSGHENKIEKTIRKMMSDGEFTKVLSDIKVPSEKVVDVKDGKRKERLQKVLPGYILLEMDLPDTNWKQCISKIRRLQGVSGFVGTSVSARPQPISTEEAKISWLAWERLRAIRVTGRVKIMFLMRQFVLLMVLLNLLPGRWRKFTMRKID